MTAVEILAEMNRTTKEGSVGCLARGRRGKMTTSAPCQRLVLLPFFYLRSSSSSRLQFFRFAAGLFVYWWFFLTFCRRHHNTAPHGWMNAASSSDEPPPPTHRKDEEIYKKKMRGKGEGENAEESICRARRQTTTRTAPLIFWLPRVPFNRAGQQSRSPLISLQAQTLRYMTANSDRWWRWTGKTWRRPNQFTGQQQIDTVCPLQLLYLFVPALARPCSWQHN